MSQGCSIGIGQTFDLGLCVKTTLLDWTPDWLVPLLPWWPLAIVVVGAGLAWRLAGAPGLAAFAAAVGFILGRRSMQHDPVETDLPPRDAAPVPPKKKKRSF